MLGNDDPPQLRPILDEATWATHVEGRVVPLGDDHELISWGYSNLTPFHSHREQTEPELAASISRMVEALRDPSQAVFNLHVPPIASGLDDAPVLDASLTVQQSLGQVKFAPAGSTAVREAIEAGQPLLGLRPHPRVGGDPAHRPDDRDQSRQRLLDRRAQRSAGHPGARQGRDPPARAWLSGPRHDPPMTGPTEVLVAIDVGTSGPGGGVRARRHPCPRGPSTVRDAIAAAGLGGDPQRTGARHRSRRSAELVRRLGPRRRVEAVSLTGQCPSVVVDDRGGR
jgi:hypothetical protein